MTQEKQTAFWLILVSFIFVGYRVWPKLIDKIRYSGQTLPMRKIVFGTGAAICGIIAVTRDVTMPYGMFTALVITTGLGIMLAIYGIKTSIQIAKEERRMQEGNSFKLPKGWKPRSGHDASQD